MMKWRQRCGIRPDFRRLYVWEIALFIKLFMQFNTENNKKYIDICMNICDTMASTLNLL